MPELVPQAADDSVLDVMVAAVVGRYPCIDTDEEDDDSTVARIRADQAAALAALRENGKIVIDRGGPAGPFRHGTEFTLTPAEGAEVSEVIATFAEYPAPADVAISSALAALARRGYYLLPITVLDEHRMFCAALQAISCGWGGTPKEEADRVLPPGMRCG